MDHRNTGETIYDFFLNFFIARVVYFCVLSSVQLFTPLTVEAPGGALRTPTRACLTRAQRRRWRSVNCEVERE